MPELLNKWLAGWASRLGAALIRWADRRYPPYPERRRYFIDHHDVRRESRGWD